MAEGITFASVLAWEGKSYDLYNKSVIVLGVLNKEQVLCFKDIKRVVCSCMCDSCRGGVEL